MKKNILFILTLIVILSLPKASFAETEDAAIESETEIVETVTPSTTRKTAEERKSELEAKKEEQKAAFEAKREEAKQEFEARREEAKQAFEAKREEFKNQLEEMKDERKQAIVERVDARLSEKNSRLTDIMLGHLEKMTEILDRIEAKAAEKGDTTVTQAIADARAAIAAAQTAVQNQAVKEYIISIGDETELKTDVSTVVEQFRTDMKATTEPVKVAREKTAKAAHALGATTDDSGSAMMPDDSTGN